jgi:hypothetical protein
MLLRLYENCLLETGVHGEDIWLGKHQKKHPNLLATISYCSACHLLYGGSTNILSTQLFVFA